MPHSVVFLRVAGCIVGILLTLPKLLLYETELGQLQNKLQDLWIRIDDLQQYALSRHTAFMRVIAAAMSRAFDRIFGNRLVSLQSLIVSICYAVSSVLLITIVIEWYVGTPIDPSLALNLLWFLLSATFPALIPLLTKGRARQKKFLLVWLTAMLTLAFVNIIAPYGEFIRLMYSKGELRAFLPFVALVSLGVVLALSLHAFFIIIVRLGLKWLSIARSAARIVLVSLIFTAPIVILYLVFKLVMLKFEYSHIEPGMDTQGVERVRALLADWGILFDIVALLTGVITFMMSSVFIIPSLLFLILSFAMLGHRLLWPLLQRPLYKLQGLEVVRRNNLLAIVGAVLLLVSLGLWEWIVSIVKLVV